MVGFTFLSLRWPQRSMSEPTYLPGVDPTKYTLITERRLLHELVIQIIILIYLETKYYILGLQATVNAPLISKTRFYFRTEHHFIRALGLPGLWQVVLFDSLDPLFEFWSTIRCQVIQQVPLKEGGWLTCAGTVAFW